MARRSRSVRDALQRSLREATVDDEASLHALCAQLLRAGYGPPVLAETWRIRRQDTGEYWPGDSNGGWREGPGREYKLHRSALAIAEGLLCKHADDEALCIELVRQQCIELDTSPVELSDEARARASESEPARSWRWAW